MAVGVEKRVMHCCVLCKAPWTSERLAVNCYKKCLRDEKIMERERRRDERRDFIRDSVRLEAVSFADIFDRLRKYSKKYFGLKLELWEVPDQFSLSVSNTHDCPVGGVTNWGGQTKGAPRGYPGWSGRWEGSVSGKRDCKLRSLFYYVFGNADGFRGFYVGTGSCGDKFSISGSIFLQDFPLVQKYVRSLKFSKRLRGEDVEWVWTPDERPVEA